MFAFNYLAQKKGRCLKSWLLDIGGGGGGADKTEAYVWGSTYETIFIEDTGTVLFIPTIFPWTVKS